MFRILTVLLPALAGVLPAAGQAPLAIVEKKAGKVGYYTEDGRRTGETAVGALPHEMIFSPDRRYLYVTDNGMLWMTDPGAGGNTISIVEIASRKRTRTIDLGRFHRPHGIAQVPGSGDVVVTVENPYGLVRVDPAGGKLVRDYDVKGTSPHMVTVGGGTAWVSNSGSGTVSAINLDSGAAEVIPTGKNPQGSTLSRDGKLLFVTNMESNTISIIDTATRRVTGEIATGVGPARVFLTPDGKTLVYNLQTGSSMGFADVVSRRETARIALPGQPLSVSLSHDGQTAYLGIQDVDKVVIVSVPRRAIVRVFDTPKGAGPDTIEPL